MSDLAKSADFYPHMEDRGSLTSFTYAYDLHQAACGSRALRNKTSVDKTLDPAIASQRIQLLDIQTLLVLNERNAVLDEFCVSWLKHRDLPIPEKE